MHFTEKLKETESIYLSCGTVRNILIENKLHEPKKRKGKNVYKRRKRMAEKEFSYKRIFPYVDG